MYEGYWKIKKLSTEFRQGIRNNPRVSKMLGGYRKYQEGIKMYEGYRKIKKLSTEFRQGIENSKRVSKMLIGYWKY